MNGFVDETTIVVSSGKGGDGAVSFRREKYVPRGGPDGGDGGKGGDVIFIVKSNLKTLSHLKLKRIFKAADGGRGAGQKMHGKDGKDALIPVPPGTVIRDPETGDSLADLTRSDGTIRLPARRPRRKRKLPLRDIREPGAPLRAERR